MSRNLSDLKIPVKKDGSIDHRYKSVQIVKSDGSRDMRTKLTADRQTAKVEKENTKQTNKVGAPKRDLSDFKIPLKKDGTIDERYKTAQVVNANGKRDMRTKLTAKR